MAARIHQLPVELVNRIAAGEVIERPASVVKELVENAIDAGASHITIEIESGGLTLIRIIDDGCGIALDDLALAFASHATSKLTSDEDLFRIDTMGFRGEALPSIGSVSQARIQSRTADNNAACEVSNNGGILSTPQPTAGNVGTTVEVRNLFFNTPARRKFLRTAATEFGHISEAVMRLALPYPSVGFTLIHNGRKVLELAATTQELRFLAAWPKEFAEQRLPIDRTDEDIHIYGLIGLPELARPTAKYQQLYLNGRSIRDKFIQHALKEAYRGLTEPGRYPAAILCIDLPPDQVDVNVHPTKMEVRFRDSGRIHGMVLAAVREKLLGSDLSPHAVTRPVAPARGASPVAVAQDARQSVRQTLADFFKQAGPSGGSRLDSGGMADDGSADPLGFGTGGPGAPSASSRIMSHSGGQHGSSPGDEADLSAAGMGQLVDRDMAGGMSGHMPVPEVRDTALEDGAASQQPQARMAASSGRTPAIQLHNSYLVAESEEGMIIIDQHALHERIMYEELRGRLSRGPLESQRLLIPATLSATPRQVAMVDQIRPLLARLGIELNSFGPDTLAIQAFPTFLQRLDPIVFVKELLERGEQELLDLHDEELLHEVLDMMACKAAVKAGDPLTPQEIEALLNRRELVERSSNCPHGRPTTLRLSLHDLEKQFKRTGF